MAASAGKHRCNQGKINDRISRPKAKKKSITVYNTICQDYDIQIGCKMCLDDQHFMHKCNKSVLLVHPKLTTMKWFLIHNVPKEYSVKTTVMCSSVDNQSKCPQEGKCKYPHSEHERTVWNIFKKVCWGVGAFITDIQSTDLKLLYVFERISNKFPVLLVCSTCYESGSYDTFLKARKKPFCFNQHPWNEENVTLVMDVNTGDNRRDYIAIRRTAMPSLLHINEEYREYVTLLQSVVSSGYSYNEIKQSLNSIKQKTKYIASTTLPVKSNKYKSVKHKTHQLMTSYGYVPLQQLAETTDEIFDRTYDDILLDEDIDVSDIEYTFRKEYLEEKSPAELYYVLTPHEDLDKLLLKQTEKYVLCTIKLDGSQKAKCTTLDDQQQEIEIRSRQNCGPTCNGDYVVIEKKKVDILDAEWKREDETEVTRGVVIGIKVQNTNRKACNFVCTVDEHFSHLMKPMCGSIPKIHVKNDPLKRLHPEVKNRRVCIYRKEGRVHIHQKTVPINPKNKTDKLFIVRYEKWEPIHMYPYGYVIKVIEPGYSLITGQQLLNINYQLPPQYGEDICHICDVKYSSGIPAEMFEGRKDCTDMNIFSIDPPGCEDIDDALSINTLDDVDDSGQEIYEVGVHISDVSAFVLKGDEIDIRAETRKTSFYPAIGDPLHLLPKKFSQDVCSLKEKEKRLALSVFFRINKLGIMQGEPYFVRTTIINQKQMCYSDAQHVITSEDINPLTNDVKALYFVSKAIKERRLQQSSLFTEIPSIYSDEEYAPDAHLLVEELMIMTNTLAAEYLIQHVHKTTILRAQEKPSKKEMKEWKNMNKDVLYNSLFLYKFTDRQDWHPPEENASMNILSSSYEMVMNAAKRGYPNPIVTIVSTEAMHPSISSAMSGWFNIQKHAKVIRYNSEQEEECRHFSLQKNHYTWFTSPIRRYMDIIVHRMIIATLDDDGQDNGTIMKKLIKLPYSVEDMDNLGPSFNKTYERARNFSKASALLKTASMLKDKPLFVPGFLESFDDDGMQFEFPYLEHMKQRMRTINYSWCGVCTKPGLPTRKDQVCKQPANFKENFRLTWKKRIYHTQKQMDDCCRSKAMAQNNYLICLNHKMNIREIPILKWNCLLGILSKKRYDVFPPAVLSLFSDTIPEIAEYIYKEDAHPVDTLQDRKRKEKEKQIELKYVDDMTSEMRTLPGKIKPLPIIKHHTQLSLDLERNTAFQIQLGGDMRTGIIQPAIKLMSISKSLDLCIEHSEDPVKCFADVATKSCKKYYRDVQEYQDTWIPMLSMESATNATQEGDPIVIHNVTVLIEKNNDQYYGSFQLKPDFCLHRHLKFIQNKSEKQEVSEDYFCLRCHLPSSGGMLPDRYKGTVLAYHFKWRNVWVGHAIGRHVSNTTDKEGEIITVTFEINQHSSSPPPDANIGKKRLYSVEFIPKSLPDRRMLAAVSTLPRATDFCQKIVLGKDIRREEDEFTCECDIPDDLDIELSSYQENELPKNNDTQHLAIRRSLTSKFTIIQGPPGTGKTLTGVKLVYWFNWVNSQASGAKRQVMYCGPSNSAVDVAVKQLKYRLADKCPKIVRVYSEMLENQVFPIPRDTVVSNTKGRKYQLISKRDQEDTALHYLIRKKGNKFSERILNFDKRFKNEKTEDITDKEIEVYQKLIADASVDELKKYEVILCTCTVSSSPRIKRGTSIYQLIIDESGMCMEPETLVPLVAHVPEQVVLIGDHKQLRPIVMNQTAKALGLEISMFERQASLCETLMLDVQYRMHREICAFPSKHFYQNKLITEMTSYWSELPMFIWPNREAPTVFCHVEGEEKSLSVATEDGNERSKWNEAEVAHTVRIYTDFVNKYNIDYSAVTILSQYKAQCKSIERRLKEEWGFEKPNVCTVVASQGDEWDYVILSTVRSMPRYEIEKRPSPGWLKKNLGFIIDHHQINVALTRARKGLVIIGNKHVLECDKDFKPREKRNRQSSFIPTGPDDAIEREPETGLWSELLKFYNRRGCVVDAKLFPSTPGEKYSTEKNIKQSLEVSEREAARYKGEHLVLDQHKTLAPRQKNFLKQKSKMFKRKQ